MSGSRKSVQQAHRLLANREFDRAQRLLEAQLQHEPGDAESWSLLGAIHGQNGRMGAAIACCEKAIKSFPGHAGAWYNLAQCRMHTGDVPQAIQAYRRATEIAPGHAGAHNNLGHALSQSGAWSEAIRHLRRAAALDPTDAFPWNNLGIAHDALGQCDQAIHCLQQAIALKPNYAEAYSNLASTLRRLNRLQEALSSVRQALSICENLESAWVQLGWLVFLVQGPEAAEVCLRDALAKYPHFDHVHASLVFQMNYHTLDAETLYAEHVAYGARFPLQAGLTHDNPPVPGRRLRVGYVSSDLRDHSVAFFLRPLLEHRDPEQVELFAYAALARQDHVTTELRRLFDHWRDIKGWSTDSIVRAIKLDGIDILVDLVGHTAPKLLAIFACKPAPVQLSYLGYPNTTGLYSIDYRLTDPVADPPNSSQKFYTEKLQYLKPGFLCYRPPESAPSIKDPPCASRGYITFGSFNDIAKLSAATARLWSEILLALPASRLLLKSENLADPTVSQRVVGMFSAHGISPERLTLHCWIDARQAHLDLYNEVDIALDPFPYQGTTTTCEALWMGVPVITLTGSTHRQRVGTSILTQVGLTDFVCASAAEYVDRAVCVSLDAALLRRLRRSLRQMMETSTLLGGSKAARNLETLYRKMWCGWCENQGSPSNAASSGSE